MFNIFRKKTLKERYDSTYGKLWNRDATLYFSSEDKVLFDNAISRYFTDTNIDLEIKKNIKTLIDNKAPYPKWVFNSDSAYHPWYMSQVFSNILIDNFKIFGKDLSFRNILNLSENDLLTRVQFIQLCSAFIFYTDPRRKDNETINSAHNIGPNIIDTFPEIDGVEYFPILQGYLKNFINNN